MMQTPLFVIMLMLFFAPLAWSDDKQDLWRAHEQEFYRAMRALDPLNPDHDYETAFSIFQRLAEKGLRPAQHNLALMYWNGEGVAQDYVRALMWLDIAAAQGFFLSKAIRDDLTDKMTPEQIAQAERLAREWVEKHKK